MFDPCSITGFDEPTESGFRLNGNVVEVETPYGWEVVTADDNRLDNEQRDVVSEMLIPFDGS